MDLNQKLRAGHVRRWHIVAVSREQTVADHMHRVGVIAEEILRILGRFDWNSNLTLNVMRWASIHDRVEALTGDVPTPTKAGIREVTELLVESDVFEMAVAKYDEEAEELRSCIAEDGECPLAGRIVKYADLLEAMNYIGIFGCGSHAHEAWTGLRYAALAAGTRVIDSLPFEEGGIVAEGIMGLLEELKEGHHWK